MTEKIYKRTVTDHIIRYLDTDNIIVLHGSRQVGKTHILYYLRDLLAQEQKPVFFIDLEDARFVDMLDKGVDAFLSYLHGEGMVTGKKSYVCIDEIQYLSNPSPFLKLITDHHKYIQLIVSGSSSFQIKKKFSDSLVGRTVDFEIYPLDFFEFLQFKEIAMPHTTDSLFHQKKLQHLYKEYILYGGYPKVVLENDITRKEKYLGQIVNTYLKRDIHDLGEIKQVNKFNAMLKLLASQSGSLLNIATLSSATGLARETVENYLFILENTYIIKLLPVWSRSSKVSLVKSPKIFFYDTGLLQTLWLSGLTGNILGSMLETSIFSDVVKKYGNEKLYFWRTKRGQEVDFILQDKERIRPIEVKMSFQGAKRTTLSSFCQKYGVKHYVIVALTGEKKTTYDTFPWEI